MIHNDMLKILPEVADALAENRPVVALESTIISHGMPYPKNVQTAMEVGQIIRDNGAVPATVAILGGKLCAGLTEEQIEYLGKGGENIAKASRRDLAVLLANKADGATTVASTMIIANMAGISVFCTGGIGGVHRGAELTMDVSADLDELGRTPVMVVCAGAKSILDIGLTLEYLETKGVSVLGFQTDELPAFYTRKSGFKVDHRVENPAQAAAMLAANLKLKLGSGMVLANPIPEQFSMDYEHITKTIEQAVEQSVKLGIRGKATTPFLLAKIKEITGGSSLEANIELVKSNAEVAAQVAAQLSKIKYR